MIKRILTISLIVLGSLFTTESYCQMYDSAAGLRGGTGATVSYKKFLGRAIAFEGILGSFDYDFFGASILIQKYTDANLGRVQWYWGVGPYLTFDRDFTAFGAMGALGVDFSFASIPIEISLDWTPRLRLAGADAKLFTRSAGVGIRYIIEY